MTISYLDLLLIFISTFTYVIYSILINKADKAPIIVYLFWIHTITYAGYVFVFLLKKFVFEHNLWAIEELIHEFTLINAPLYIVMGLAMLGSLLIYNILLTRYPVAVVILFSQISLLFISTAYISLGDPMHLASFLAITLICCGALISAIDKKDWPNILKGIINIPLPLWLGILIESIMLTVSAVITFILTQQTFINQKIITGLKFIYPFSFHNPFYFNVGVRFFVMITLLMYILMYANLRKYLLPLFFKERPYIVLISLIYLISMLTYSRAYLITLDKDVLATLSRLNVPIVLFLTSFIFKEPIEKPQIYGSVIMVIGAIVALFSWMAGYDFVW